MAGETDDAIAARVGFFNHRVVEELYDYEKDPDALQNLIGNPEYAELAARMRKKLEVHMEEAGDPALAVFQKRNSLSARQNFIRTEEEKAARLNNSVLGRKRN